MGWNRSATILSVVTFLAFGFMVIGVFSDPLSNDMLSIAAKDDITYGILGYCSDSDGCSGYSLGYTLDSSSSWPASADTLTKAFIVHIIAAGLLLITLILALACHFRCLPLWIATAVVLGISCIAAALAFAFEMYVFKLNLKFAGWFGLAAAILSFLSLCAMGIMYRNLQAQLGTTSVDEDDKSIFLGGSGDFSDEKFGAGLAKDDFAKPPSLVTAYPVPENRLKRHSLSLNRNSFNSHSLMRPQKGYERIPESKNGSTSTLGMQSRAHLLPLPLPKSSDSVGAVNQPPHSAGTGANAKSMYPGNGSSSTLGAGSYGTGAAAVGTGAAAVATGAAGAAAGAGSKMPGYGEPLNVDRTKKWESTKRPAADRQDTWSQIALQKNNNAVRASNVSIASSQAANVPAGKYLGGVDNSEAFGPNVVQIPKLRNGDVAQSATLDYQKDETQTVSPLGASKVPNYSRMGNSDNSPSKSPSKPLPPQPNTQSGTHSAGGEASQFADGQQMSDQYGSQAYSQAYNQFAGFDQSMNYSGYGYESQPPIYADPTYMQYAQQAYMQPAYSQAPYQQMYAQPAYAQPAYGQPTYTPNSGYNRPPRLRATGPSSKPQTSDVVLNNNPDFSIGGLGKKRRPGRP